MYVCVYVCVSAFSNTFSAETTKPTDTKFQGKPLWNGGTKVCSNGPGHITKMALLIYGKKLLRNQKAYET